MNPYVKIFVGSSFLCATFFIAPAQTLPPVTKGVTNEDIDALKEFVHKDKRYLKSPFSAQADESSQNLCKQFCSEYLVEEKHYNELHYITNYNGHKIWAEPYDIVLSAMGMNDGFEWQSAYSLSGAIEGVNRDNILSSIAAKHYSDQTSDNSKPNIFDGQITVSYRPVDIVLKAVQNVDLYVDGEADFEVTASDPGEKYVYSLYELNEVNPDSEYAELLTKSIVTGDEGKAKFRLKGIKEGKFTLKIGYSYDYPNYKKLPHLESFTSLEVEVKGPEVYEYTINGLEKISAPYSFTVSGSFTICPKTFNEKGEPATWTYSSSDAVFSGPNGSVTCDTKAFALDSTGRYDNVGIGLNTEELERMSKGEVQNLVLQKLGDGIKKIPMLMLGKKPEEPKVEPNPPMVVVIRPEEGSYSCSFKLEDAEKMTREKIFKQGKLFVLPALKSMNRMMDFTQFKAFDGVFLTATATVKKVEKEQ